MIGDGRRRTVTDGRKRRLSHTLAVVVVVLLLVFASTATDVVGQEATDGDGSASGATATNETDESGETNETVDTAPLPRHENPRETTDDGDIEALQDRLARELAGRLLRSTIQISEGDYQRARTVVGEDYDETLRTYVRVSRDAQGNDVIKFERTRDSQQRFVDSVANYRETADAYRAAKERGDESAARAHARALEDYAREVDETGSSLEANFTQLGETGTFGAQDPAVVVGQLRANITAEQRAVRSAEFDPTTLTVLSTTETGSFENPVVVTARVVNGTAAPAETATPAPTADASFADTELTVTVNGRMKSVSTDETGRFSVAYRPTVEALGPQTLTVGFRPSDDSRFLGSNDTAAVVVEGSVTPTLTVDTTPSAGRYGDQVAFSGQVSVGDLAVPDLPVTVRVGDVVLGEATTDATGAFAFETTLPAEISPGETPVVAAFLDDGRAIAPAASPPEPFVVGRTPTTLVLTATQDGPERALVTGTLTTVEGRPVRGVAVTFSVDGEQVRTVQTGGDGSFAGVVWASRADTEDSSVTITGTFADPSSNLGASSDDAIVEMTFVGGGGGGGGETGTGDGASAGFSTGVLVDAVNDALSATGVRVDGGTLAVAVVALIALVTGVALRRRRQRSTADAGVSASTPAGDGDAGRSSALALDPLSLLAVARRRLAANDVTGAVEVAYVSSRAHLANRLGVPNTGTHREFGARVRGDPDADAFDEVTDAYEEAVFSPRPPTRDRTSRVLSLVERLIPFGRR